MRFHPGLTLTAVVLSSASLLTAPAFAAKPRAEVIKAEFGVSEPLTAIAARPQPAEAAGVEIPERGTFVPDNGFNGDVSGVQDPDANPGIQVIPPSVSFDGLTGTAKPPDPVGDVGPNHYVEMVNTRVGVYTKAGANLLNVTIGSIFTGLPGVHNCEGNHGDPVVVHDQLANRWLLTQFTAAAPFFLCVAVSQTANPTGAYFLYAFSTGVNFPDYPKFGVWPGGYLASTREFNGAVFAGVGTYALERSQMLVGGAAKALKVLLTTAGGAWQPGDGLLPADLDGTTLPPIATLAPFVGTMDNGAGTGAPFDGINVFHLRWNFASNAATLTLVRSIPGPAIDTIYPCAPGSRDCLEQAGTAQKLDILSYRQRPMHRAAYRNFGTHESLVTNQSAEYVFAGTSRAGLRWWELRGLSTNAPTLFQSGPFVASGVDRIHRWMGSIAQDRRGNMIMGYSISSANMFPSIRYTGRLVTDAPNVMPQGEGQIIAGTGAQTGSPRWGDYTSMNIDPADDCTFWYVNQYYAVTGATWRTRVGHFRFPAPTC